MEGETDVAYANSQMFIAEAEDLYAGLQKYFATIGQLVTPHPSRAKKTNEKLKNIIFSVFLLTYNKAAQDGLRRGMRVSNVVS